MNNDLKQRVVEASEAFHFAAQMLSAIADSEPTLDRINAAKAAVTAARKLRILADELRDHAIVPVEPTVDIERKETC